MVVGEGVELVDEALGVDPAQTVPADVELAGVVADDHGIGQEAVRRDAAPQRALGGDAHGIGGHLESGDAEVLEMRLPRRRAKVRSGCAARRAITGPANARPLM